MSKLEGLVALAIIGGLVAVLMLNTKQAQDDCQASGGAYLRGAFGHQCVAGLKTLDEDRETACKASGGVVVMTSDGWRCFAMLDGYPGSKGRRT